MPRNERSLLFTIVGLLAILNVVLLLQPATPVAQADDAASADPTLGPAAAIELTPGSAEGEAITLRNEEGHIAWGEHPQQRVWSMGYVHIGPMLNQLMDAEEFKEEREGLSAELKEKDEEISAMLQEIQEEFNELGDDEVARQEIMQRGQSLYEEYQKFQQQAEMLQQGLAADQIERAYRELVAAVNVVADRLDLDLVQRFIPTEDEFQGLNIETAMQEIRLRSMLRYPEGCDITSEVREELNLESE